VAHAVHGRDLERMGGLLARMPRTGAALLVGLAALAAAVVIALQLGVTHWFYLYIVWFLPLVLVALLGRYREPAR
jgi:NADH:ubiquinone oxidoreductase subunit 5 (subunit L)/multisubunit Na+/H+ antiporter MnhA subunit